MGVLCCLLVVAFICHSQTLEIEKPLHSSKRYQDNARTDPNNCMSRTKQVVTNTHNFSIDIRMPGVVPTRSDSYLCMAVPVPTIQDAYVVDFLPVASMDTAHHMLLYGCQTPASYNSYWDCGSTQGTCEDDASILYAWARNAPPTKLPTDVGFRVGGNSRVSYFVLQIHYGDVNAFRDHHRDCSGLTLRMTTKPQPFIAGMYLLMSMDTVILPGKRVTNADIACDYTSYPIHPFAFRTHTHHLGKVVSGYRIRDGKWTLIGRQSPLLPQAFYAANKDADIKYGDTVAARCVFSGEGRTSKTYIGGTSDDEMCNFYIMYYMDSKHAVPFMNCMETGSKELFRHIPAEANVPIPVSPEQMMPMMHTGHRTDHQENKSLLETNRADEEVLNQGDFYSLLSKLLDKSKDVVHVHKYNPSVMQKAQAELVAQIDNIMQKKDLGLPSSRLVFPAREDTILVRDRVHKFHQFEATARPPGNKLVDENKGYHVEEVPTWPESYLQLGQVSGLALDSDDNLVIFHRGDHRWGVNSFDNQAIYQQMSLGPIQQSTILVVDPVKGRVLKASGRNMFYLPHGITTDADNNYWVTDVALHQVFKLSSDGRDKVLVALGQAFMPGTDKKHFCQPTDVAVDTVTGNIYISDGYCNARILKFTADGKYLSEWGAGSSDGRNRKPFRIPHSLVFLPDRQELCVADRENGNIQCFVANTGEFVKEISKKEFGGEVYAVSYSPAGGGLIFAVNGESPYGHSAPLRGFVINYSTQEIVDSFSPEKKKFKMPHDIVVSKDGSVFVGDAGSDAVFKFTSEKAHRSVKKSGIEVQEEMETFVQTNRKPVHTVSMSMAVATHPKMEAVAEKQPQLSQTPAKQQQPATDKEKTMKEKGDVKQSSQQAVSPAVITTLLLIPLVLIISVGIFIRWTKTRMYGSKTASGLNLGNFFASHKGYSQQGFDRLSTEGSDQEKDEEESTDSDNEEYSAPPPTVSSS
ncbi:peptidyl-glycine alpha-amidating monooxygenase isoform X2 [Myripristis murdjan]|uniref:peptidyl-glycine alpha-amidating monooxygenase isoform X2 n=1 Tax=Myripristis murdjan TaxID=586833 RepID=UPI0011762245|nr:peptidyl-glycine alpha-amidating monooxygenase isoform X2 [Myripristis murdjan]